MSVCEIYLSRILPLKAECGFANCAHQNGIASKLATVQVVH